MATPVPAMKDGEGQKTTLAAQKAQIRRGIQRFEAGEEEGAIHSVIRCVTRAEARGVDPETLIARDDMPAEMGQAIRAALAEPIEAADQPGDTLGVVGPAVDTSEMRSMGAGEESLYAYGFSGYPDRLKIGMNSSGPPERRIAQQVGLGTPDQPKLFVVYRCRDARRLERAVHAVLDCRGRRVEGIGSTWFHCSVEDLLETIAFVVDA